MSELEAKLSVIPLLLQTQDQFISIISVKTPDLDRLFNILEASILPANLFLKHLAILADFGGEPLQRVSREFEMLFPEGKLNDYWGVQAVVKNIECREPVALDNSSSMSCYVKLAPVIHPVRIAYNVNRIRNTKYAIRNT